MSDIELVSDGDGLAIFGDSTAIERFLESEDLTATSLDLTGLAPIAASGAAVTQAGASIMENSGRWLKLTEDSAAKVKKYGLMDTKSTGVKHAMIGEPGSIKSWLKISTGPTSMATNPAVLAGAAGIMTQLAMQQTMDQITDYLERIDAKLDDVLRAQKDGVLAKMIGIGFVIEEALTLRDAGGRVNQVTWSKVQATTATVAETQAYALRQLEAMTEKVEKEGRISELADATKSVESQVREWLAVLARCFQLQDAIAVLELDRVLDSIPDELDSHRVGLRAAREKRADVIEKTTRSLLTRMDVAAQTANAKVLTNPIQSPAIVRSRESVASSVGEFRRIIGVEAEVDSVDARRWRAAAGDLRTKVVDSSSERLDASRQRGSQAFGWAKSRGGAVSTTVSQRVRRRGQQTDVEEQSAGPTDD